MGDGVGVDPHDDGAEQAELASEARLLRRTRWRLVLWSGVSTLALLLVLGGALYAAVQNRLVTASVDQLRATVTPVVNSLSGTDADHGAGTDAPGSFGLQPGRGSIWLYAFDESGQQVPLNRRLGVPLAGMPEPVSLAAARTAPDGTDVREVTLTIGSTTMPARLLTQRFVYVQDGQTYFLQAIQDRTVEVQTLDTLLTVLLGGGAIVLIVSVLFGYVYASRAMVPIRVSLQAQREALRRQREFAADASHELRTPLTVIRSSVEHLTRHPDKPVGEQREALDDIDAEVSSLTSLVDDLLLLARSDSGAVALERMPLDLGDVAFEAAGALGRPAEDRGVHVEVDPEPAMLMGDPARLRQLVTILVDNAIRHSPRGGRVRVVVRSAAGTASVEVTDEGPGLREEDMPHVFDRFWRAPGAPSGGTGLGLAIARWIVDRHGGRIGVANRPEGGAAFRVELPSDGPADAPATRGDVTPPPMLLG
ncbi:MAG: sensor histidine kinase [Candidatus Limnocylindrales bacterium]